jgi:glycerophosphoryl diester phosphodiesterase
MKKIISRILLSLLILLTLSGIIIVLISRPAASRPYYSGDLPQPTVIAHQGGDGLWPGDTMYAFEHAVALGVDVLEMDAHLTKDGQIVLMHDERVDRTTDGSGLIEDMTLADLQKLDAAYGWSPDGGQTFPFRGQGIKVPTLGGLFKAFPDMRYVIEIKLTKTPIAQPFCDLIHQYDMQDKVIVASFHDDAMQMFRDACPDVATSASRGEVTKFVLLEKVFLSSLVSPKYESLQVPYDPSESLGINILTGRFIRDAHKKNLRVEPWTVNDQELMQKYIKMGVDGLMTDRPDLLLELLGRSIRVTVSDHFRKAANFVAGINYPTTCVIRRSRRRDL